MQCWASGGYPWTIVRMKSRDQYMAALEAASVGGDIKPFAILLRTKCALISAIT